MASRKHKQRAWMVSVMLLGLCAVVGLVLYALRQNINLYYTPTRLLAASQLPRARIRIGGMVQKGSVHYTDQLTVNFIVTDFTKQVAVTYTGVLPDLFREGQGVVAMGTLGSDHVFMAEQILAKHDENYMPPELKNAA